MIADPEGDAVRDETRVEALEAERDRLKQENSEMARMLAEPSENQELRAENALLRKALAESICRRCITRIGNDGLDGCDECSAARRALARIPEAKPPHE